MAVTASAPARPALPAWASGAATVTALYALWIVSVSLDVHAPPWMRTGALFVHLAALVVGLGSVVVIDWTALRWVMRKCTYDEVRKVAGSVHMLIWSALAVLMLSGAVLNPDTGATITRVKLALVLVLATNGLHAKALGLRMGAVGDTPSRALLLRATTIAIVSQVCWWTVMLLGHVNTQG